MIDRLDIEVTASSCFSLGSHDVGDSRQEKEEEGEVGVGRVAASRARGMECTGVVNRRFGIHDSPK